MATSSTTSKTSDVTSDPVASVVSSTTSKTPDKTPDPVVIFIGLFIGTMIFTNVVHLIVVYAVSRSVKDKEKYKNYEKTGWIDSLLHEFIAMILTHERYYLVSNLFTTLTAGISIYIAYVLFFQFPKLRYSNLILKRN